MLFQLFTTGDDPPDFRPGCGHWKDQGTVDITGKIDGVEGLFMDTRGIPVTAFKLIRVKTAARVTEGVSRG